VRASNYEPPSIGPYGGQFDGELGNLVGWGDLLRGIVTVTEGLRRYHGLYEIPVTRYDTRLSAEARYAKARVVESPFDDLDIESRFYSYELGVHQPVYQSPRSRLEVGVVANWRRTRTRLLGETFSFPGSGAEDGETTAMVMRFIADFVSRDARQVFAARSQVSWGIDALGATIHHGRDAEPDGRFVSWLLQLQWARRFPWFGIEAVFRTDLQISNQPLLTMEQIAVGGYSTVRGYRQNQVVSDQAVVSSAEIRVPIWRRPDLGGTVALAPFVDYAHVWDHEDRLFARSRNLASVGIGLRWDLPRFLSARLYWGHNLTNVDTSGDLQDHGLQFLVTLSFP
jgi:hemolysin activation/secretion protein